MIGRIRTDTNILIMSLPAKLALSLRDFLLQNGAARPVALKKSGFGAIVTQDYVWEMEGGIKIYLWVGFQIIVADE